MKLAPITTLCCAALATGSASAQFFGSLSRNNVAYDLVSVPDSATADAPRIRFSADGGATNVGFSFWWFYRISGDTRESTLNSSGGQLTSSNFAPSGVATLEWEDVDGRGISAAYLISARETGAADGTSMHHLTVTNNTAGPITIDLFAYCDIDHCNSTGGDNATGTNDRHLVADAGCPGVDAEFHGIGSVGYAAGDYPTVLDSLVDNGVTNLGNTGLPHTGDYTGAMQWTSPTLQVGESFTALATLSHGHSFNRCMGGAPSARNYGVGLAGAGGVPTIESLVPPVVGTAGKLRIGNAPANAAGALTLGITQLNGDAGIPLLGLQLYVAVQSVPIAIGPTGEFDLQLVLPLNSSMCNFDFHFQAFIQDISSPAQLPLIHTGGLEWSLGQ